MNNIVVARVFLEFISTSDEFNRDRPTESINSLLDGGYEGFGGYDLKMVANLYASIREENNEYDVLVDNVKKKLVPLIKDFQEELKPSRRTLSTALMTLFNQ